MPTDKPPTSTSSHSDLRTELRSEPRSEARFEPRFERRDARSSELEAELEREANRLSRASEILGHRFRDPSLLLCALTHKSLRNERATSVGDNEVLELVGDAVLGLITVDALVDQSPHASEGELTERRAAHVSESSLAARADALGLAELLRTGRGIAGRVPVSTRADVVEALLGAVHRDAGIDAARAVAVRILGPPPADARPAGANAKRDLQERLQRLFGEAPSYEMERGNGPNHAPTYTATARFRSAALGKGTGGNKRAASEAAAADALERLGDDDSLRARFQSG